MGFSAPKGTGHKGDRSSSALLDLEIIAQGEADEKHANDRKEVLEDHQELKACRRNGRAFVR